MQPEVRSKMKAALKATFGKKAKWWVKALRTSALIGLAFPFIAPVAGRALPGRSLTEGETTMLREIFKESVDYSKIKIHSSKLMDRASLGNALGKTSNGTMVLRSDILRSDYSKNSEYFEKIIFVHEVAHIWQSQNCVISKPSLRTLLMYFNRKLGRSTVEKDYGYTLTSAKDLTGYNHEQQADIVAEFFTLAQKGYFPSYMSLQDMPQTATGTVRVQANYRAVLRNFTANPSYARNLCKK